MKIQIGDLVAGSKTPWLPLGKVVKEDRGLVWVDTKNGELSFLRGKLTHVDYTRHPEFHRYCAAALQGFLYNSAWPSSAIKDAKETSIEMIKHLSE